MARIVQRINDIKGTNQGGTAIATLVVGPRYFSNTFNFYVNNVLTAVTTVVDRIRVKVNEKAVWDVDAARFLKRWNFNNPALAVGQLVLDYAQASRADKTDELYTAFDTYGERSMTVEFTLKTLAAPSDVIRITGVSSFDFGAWVNRTTGQREKHPIYLNEVSDNLINGAADITKISTRQPIQRIFFDTASTISLVEIDADGTRMHEASTADNNALLKPYGLDGTVFAYVYAPDYSEQIEDHLIVRNTLNTRVTAGAANPVFALVESLGNGFVG
jgi:hypothetical protein